MAGTKSRRRRTEWVDDATFARQCRAALARLEREYEREGDAAIVRLAKSDPLGFCMATAVLASEEK